MYLGLDQDDYYRLLVETGLGHERKGAVITTLTVKDARWKELQIIYNLPEEFFETRKKMWNGYKHLKWVQLGRKMCPDDHYHAGNQQLGVKIQSFKMLLCSVKQILVLRQEGVLTGINQHSWYGAFCHLRSKCFVGICAKKT